MTSKKFSDFTDGGAFQANDAILIARSGDNFRIDGGIIANTISNVSVLQGNVAGFAGSISNASTRVTNLEANVAVIANATSDASTQIAALRSDLANAAVVASTADMALQANIATNANAIANVSARVSTLEAGSTSTPAPTPTTGGANFAPPKVADFPDTTSVVVAGPLTMTDDATDGLLLSITPVTGDKASFALKSVPASGDWTVTMRIKQINLFLDFGMQGICFTTNNSSGYAYLFGPEISRNFASLVQYNGGGGYGATPFARPTAKPVEWLRIVYFDSTSSYVFLISDTGKVWTQIGYQSQTSFGGKINKIGVGFGTNQSPIVDGYQFRASIPYWNQSW
jgi:hypothetical protein